MRYCFYQSQLICLDYGQLTQGLAAAYDLIQQAKGFPAVPVYEFIPFQMYRNGFCKLIIRMNEEQRGLYQNILCKFMLNIPKQELEDVTRLSYHAQKAFYYYLDELLPDKDIKDWQKVRSDFLFKLKQYSPSSVRINPQLLVNKIVENKPVCGAIIFNNDSSKILMVRVRSKWGFPKGKLNQNESAEQCAIREVQQQTGINIQNKLDSRIKIQFEMFGGQSTFFVARGVRQTQRIKIDSKEIHEISWLNVQDICRDQNRFVERSRIAWGIYQKKYASKESNDVYISKYSKKDNQKFDYTANPLLGFKLDRGKLLSILYEPGPSRR